MGGKCILYENGVPLLFALNCNVTCVSHNIGVVRVTVWEYNCSVYCHTV